MKIIYNNIIPFKGFKAINLFGVLFVRNNSVMTSSDMTHERIHTAQMREMLYVFFYVWYIVEWLVRLIQYHDSHMAYRNISFEREAYSNQFRTTYLDYRKHYSWWKYLTKEC